MNADPRRERGQGRIDRLPDRVMMRDCRHPLPQRWPNDRVIAKEGDRLWFRVLPGRQAIAEKQRGHLEHRGPDIGAQPAHLAGEAALPMIEQGVADAILDRCDIEIGKVAGRGGQQVLTGGERDFLGTGHHLEGAGDEARIRTAPGGIDLALHVAEWGRVDPGQVALDADCPFQRQLPAWGHDIWAHEGPCSRDRSIPGSFRP